MKLVSIPTQEVDWTQQMYASGHGFFRCTLFPFRFLAQPIGDSYRHFSKRLLIYLSFAALLIICTFLVMGTADKSYFLVRFLPLICTLALHIACVFTFSHVLIDIAANQLKHLDMAYESRNIGRQWIVLYSGLTLGFCIHQITFPKLLILCGIESSIQLPINIWIVPLLCASIYSNLFTVFINQKPQNKKQAEIHTQKKIQMSLPSTGLESKQPQIVNLASVDQFPRTTASFKTNGRWVKIALKTISHVSVEEHYSRVFYRVNQRIQNILVRQSLKQLHSKLGQNDFIQIHRSHLVNKKHIIEYKQKKRNHWLKLESSNYTLPISRRKQKQVKKVLQEKF